MSPKEVSVAEAKKHFSDLLGRVAYRGERITISKRGKPIAILVPVSDSPQEEHLGKVNGWLDSDDPFFDAIGQIISDRSKHLPRVFNPERA